MLDHEASASGEHSLRRWLESVGLSEYAALFVRHRIDLDALPNLTEPDLAKLGVPLGDRKRLRRAMASPPGAAGTTTAAASAGTVAERRQLTVMFCDMVGSTSLSAKFDPEDVRDIIAGFRETCVRVVKLYDGFAARYIGDGILVYFGYPNAHEDDAERAVRAALDIVQALSTARTSGQPLVRGHVPEVRIGIATGLAVVGDLIGQRTEERASAVGETPNHTSTAFHPFVQQLKFALGLERDGIVMPPFSNLEAAITAAKGDVERVAPLFGALLAIPTGDRYAPLDLSPRLQKDATVAALADHFAGLAHDLPLVVAFEDAHWIDPTSHEVLDLLVEKVQNAPILLIVTGRSEFQASWKLQHHITTSTLKRLNRPLQQTFVERVAGARELPREIVEEVLLKTDGVPLFIEELTKTVIESDFLT